MKCVFPGACRRVEMGKKIRGKRQVRVGVVKINRRLVIVDCLRSV